MLTLEAKFKREFSFRDVDAAVPEDPYGTGSSASAWQQKDYMDF
jgi:DNA-directed RNA polymerase II subunit RPB11